MKRLNLIVAAVILTSLTVTALTVQQASAEPVKNGYYLYSFDVDADGRMLVKILFHAEGGGSSWLLVPKQGVFVNWTYTELRGSLTLKDLSEVKPEPHYFYLNFSFGYSPDEYGVFELEISYGTSYGAFIIEPEGFFYSTQIGFDRGFDGRAEVLLPEGALGDGLSLLGKAEVGVEHGRVRLRFNGLSGFDRLAVGFKVSSTPRMVRISKGIFRFEGPERYLPLAERILNLYNEAYPILSRVYGVDLESIELRFFPPSLELLRTGMSGYVPFLAGERPGAIHLNLFYVRAASGFMEVVAIHELSHHFTWKVGFKPAKLWVHEGLAEYFGVNVALQLGYREGVEEHLRRLKEAMEATGGNYGFIQFWRPTQYVVNPVVYYAASYGVFKALAEKYGGYDFYRRFFELVKGFGGVDDDCLIVSYLSKAAGEDLFPVFKEWGFQVAKPGEEGYVEAAVRMMVEEARLRAGEINGVFLKPAKGIVEGLTGIATTLLRLGLFEQARYLVALSNWVLSMPAVASTAYYLVMLTLIAIAVKQNFYHRRGFKG
ncbi:MAG: hypothetical protein QXQ92_06520 [Candidatus Nezhaarchaeales archaeon]